jgi:hypothetical protein
MGLLGNGFRNSLGVHRALGDLPARVAAGRYSAFSNTRSQDMASAVLSDLSFPVGLPPDAAWYPPQTGGAMSMRASASGDMTANLYPSYPMSIDFTGAGDLSGDAALAVSMLVAMSGSGTLTAALVGNVDMSADFSGSGDLSASLSALGNMLVAMSGSGDLDATIAAYGNMSIDIVVSGTGLTVENVGAAVWGYLLSCGYSAEQAMQILTAVAAGKTTIVDNGGGSADVTFRDLPDTKDVVAAEMQDSERINVVLDP